mgnify:FL=1
MDDSMTVSVNSIVHMQLTTANIVGGRVEWTTDAKQAKAGGLGN